MPSWILESLLASIPSLVAALIWIIKLGSRLETLEASFMKCQGTRDKSRVEVLSAQRALADQADADRRVLADKLEAIATHIGDIKGRLELLVDLVVQGKVKP